MRSRRDSRFASDDVRLGYINGVFGLRGDVRLYLYNPESDLVGMSFEMQLVSPSGDRQTVVMAIRSGSGRRILATVDGVDTPEAAGALKGYELVLSEEHLPQEADGEWYHRDLIGTAVATASGEELGVLAEIVSGPGMDTWIVRKGRAEVWVHARGDDLIEVSPGQQIVVADPAVLRISEST